MMRRYRPLILILTPMLMPVITALGIDPRTEYPANGRPITLIRDGNPIPQLLA